MFSNLNWWEIIGLALLGLFIFGPERLPKVIGDAARMVRGLRNMARNATSDLSRELGTDVSLEDLHPKTFIRKHILSDEEQAELRRPFDDLTRDVRSITSDMNTLGSSGPLPPPGASRYQQQEQTRYQQEQARYDQEPASPTTPRQTGGARHRRDDYDDDVT